MSLAELRAALDAANVALRALHEAIGSNEPTEDQAAEWEKLSGERSSLTEAVEVALKEATEEERKADEAAQREAAEAELAAARLRKVQAERAKFGEGVDVNIKQDDTHLRYCNPMAAPAGQVRSALLRRAEAHLHGESAATQKRFEDIIRFAEKHHTGTHAYQARAFTQTMLVRASDEYTRGFEKYITGNAIAMTPDEARAVAVGTSAQGGYLLPTFLDPTVILTSTATIDTIRTLSTARGGVRTMLPGTGMQWNGITSTGSTGSWDAELTAVSDDTPTFGRDGIPIKHARIWVEASIQSLTNISSIEADLRMILEDARIRLEAETHATGAGGSNTPTGLFTALVANTASYVQVTTSAAIGIADINSLHRAVPLRWRVNSEWLMNPVFSDAIQALGTQLGVQYTGSIAEQTSQTTLKGRPAYANDLAPGVVTTTNQDPLVAHGDFGAYYLIDRPGTAALEFVPHVFDPTTGRPVSKRGWLLWFEHGADLFLDNAFRLLVNKTSA